jgi:hypothetical protein
MGTETLFSDNDSVLIRTVVAVIYAPGNSRRRDRFPENCVQPAESAEAALAAANPDKGFHAARVNGPSRSSEGFRMYYLVEWL